MSKMKNYAIEMERLQDERQAVYWILTEAPELNMSNYTDEEASALNDAVIEAVLLMQNNGAPEPVDPASQRPEKGTEP